MPRQGKADTGNGRVLLTTRYDVEKIYNKDEAKGVL
jgi:hypothetical protein